MKSSNRWMELNLLFSILVVVALSISCGTDRNGQNQEEITSQHSGDIGSNKPNKMAKKDDSGICSTNQPQNTWEEYEASLFAVGIHGNHLIWANKCGIYAVGDSGKAKHIDEVSFKKEPICWKMNHNEEIIVVFRNGSVGVYNSLKNKLEYNYENKKWFTVSKKPFGECTRAVLETSETGFVTKNWDSDSDVLELNYYSYSTGGKVVHGGNLACDKNALSGCGKTNQDGSFVIGSKQRQVQVLSTKDMKPSKDLGLEQIEHVQKAYWLSEDVLLAIQEGSSLKTKILLWKISTNSLLWSSTELTPLSISSNERLLLARSHNGQGDSKVVDIQTGEIVDKWRLRTLSSTCRASMWNNSGEVLVEIDGEDLILWSAKKKKRSKVEAISCLDEDGGFQKSPDGKLVAISNSVWDFQSGKLLRLVSLDKSKEDDFLRGLYWSRNGDLVAIVFLERIVVWGKENGYMEITEREMEEVSPRVFWSKDKSLWLGIGRKFRKFDLRECTRESFSLEMQEESLLVSYFKNSESFSCFQK